MYARNAYNSEFSDCVAFFDVDEPTRTVTGSRTEFLGRNGTLRDPAAMHRVRLSGKTGAGLDPCAAMQVTFDLADGAASRDRFSGSARQATPMRPASWCSASADPQPPQMRSPP